eukprot:365961-Chlamydomonas_euryale.AAC.19
MEVVGSGKASETSVRINEWMRVCKCASVCGGGGAQCPSLGGGSVPITQCPSLGGWVGGSGAQCPSLNPHTRGYRASEEAHSVTSYTSLSDRHTCSHTPGGLCRSRGRGSPGSSR